ncbi:hypothetical protein [Echinimonas agarilytica]|uniref:Uncharacterized protein n=1 Tax=Echinimonas agarilytica TaxID=1215918 RepID=A0AA42B8K1_9GAMM|nr:hypothetical protein [Echinimonas agarilytica]MCM2680663.1 hypothetical protein [Echinimonas agarilytica]
MLLTGAFILVFVGFVHSILGEKYILIRLFRRENLPELLGSDWFTKRTIRFTWHLTTVAWWGFASVLYVLSNQAQNVENQILVITSATFAISGFISFFLSRGKHLSWLFFFAVAGIALSAVLINRA